MTMLSVLCSSDREIEKCKAGRNGNKSHQIFHVLFGLNSIYFMSEVKHNKCTVKQYPTLFQINKMGYIFMVYILLVLVGPTAFAWVW